jgi:hypothetical protein
MNIKRMIAAVLLLSTSFDCAAQEITTEGKKAYFNGNVIAAMKTPMRRTGFSVKAVRQAIKDAKDGTPKPEYQDGTCYIEDAAEKKLISFGMYSTKGRYFSTGYGGFVVFLFDNPDFDFTIPAAHIAKFEFYTKKIKVNYDVSGIAPEVLLTFVVKMHLIKSDGTIDTAFVKFIKEQSEKYPLLGQQQVDVYERNAANCSSLPPGNDVQGRLRLEYRRTDTLLANQLYHKYFDVFDSTHKIGSITASGSWEAWATEDGEFNYKHIKAINEVKVEPVKYFFYNNAGCETAEYNTVWVYNLRGGRDKKVTNYINLDKEFFASRMDFMTELANRLQKEEKIF